MSEIKREAEAEERLDGLFDDAFRANDEPMLDYVRLKFELKALRQERDTLARRVAELEGFIAQRGYRRCDIPACNCPSFHGGHAEQRLKEIEDVCLERVDWQGTLLKTVAAAIAAPPVRDEEAERP